MRVRRTLALALFLFLTAASLPVYSDENKNCHLKQLASLDLARFPGHVLAPVTIQGNSVWMSLHTGSAFGLIFEDDARALQLRQKRLPIPPGMSVGAKGEVTQVAVTDLQMGGARFRDVEFVILSRGAYAANFDQRPIVGGLGMDLLSRVDFELDIAHGKLNLFSQDHCRGWVVYWSGTVASIPARRSDLGELYFPIELDGKTLEAVMSPGSPQSTLRTDVARKLYGIDEHSAGNEMHPAANVKTHTHRVMNLRTPAFEVRNEAIELLPQDDNYCVVAKHGSATGYDGCRGEHPLQLGIDVLSKLRIYCATKEQVLYLTPADPAAPDSPSP